MKEKLASGKKEKKRPSVSQWGGGGFKLGSNREKFLPSSESFENNDKREAQNRAAQRE